MIFNRDQNFYDRVQKAQRRMSEYAKYKASQAPDRQIAKYDPGHLAIDMILVPFIFDPATGKMEPTYVEKN